MYVCNWIQFEYKRDQQAANKWKHDSSIKSQISYFWQQLIKDQFD